MLRLPLLTLPLRPLMLRLPPPMPSLLTLPPRLLTPRLPLPTRSLRTLLLRPLPTLPSKRAARLELFRC